MPVIILNTNLKEIPKNFDMELCRKASEVLNKPFERITLTVHTGVHQVRMGSSEPTATVDIHAIGIFDKEKNPTYTPPLLEFVAQKLGLPEKRVVLLYHDLQPHNIGQRVS